MPFSQVIAVSIFFLLCYVIRRSSQKGDVPAVRCWPSIFPEFLDRLSYNKHAVQLVNRGYRQYRDRPFRLLKLDMDLVVMPLKYAVELRAITSDMLDPLTASFDDNAGNITSILLGSELHTHAIQRRLTPRLPQVLPMVMDELRHAFDQVLPAANDDWIPVKSYEMVLHLSTRAAARLFVGEPICRDEKFIETTASYSRNTFNTIDTSRSLGHMFTSFLGSFVSTVKDAREQLEYIQVLLGAEVQRRRENLEEKHDDFLQWCMDLARTEGESQPGALAHRTLGILSMAVVHTTAMATTHLLYDITTDEDLKARLRKEQEFVLKDGWTGITQQYMLEMKELDSLMRESQRINPVGEFTFRRLVRQPITLSDGFRLEPGQQIAIPAKCINTDDELLSDAASFRPRRWLKQKQAAPTSFSNSSASNLHFGLGRYACPGRFVAAYMIKAITSRLLLDYDFKLQTDFESRRPPNIIHGDKILPNREAIILLKRRNR